MAEKFLVQNDPSSCPVAVQMGVGHGHSSKADRASRLLAYC